MLSFHVQSWYVLIASPVLKSILKIGIIAAKENKLKTVESKLNIKLKMTYFL
jgi:hypothetical protein